MKKRKLVLKTETVRQMQPSELRQVAGGTAFETNCYCGLYVNTAIVGTLVSMDGKCIDPNVNKVIDTSYHY
jgi:hypothetical protein